ncbi:MAG: polynucleotide adenylyltransferase PcnB [Spirochaetae bacterium HGW-Spirochaetae-9]|nr:MAG: polynucleotide adenylyltransferase PcnB [Spirochaetae bacterium HGW-Spirochaetae-9]
MFIRYRRDKNGKPVEQARIYTEREHGIGKAMIDPEAARIIERLKGAGHQAYIVGGAVRDLLQNKKPKDFDLVTDALPTKIKKLFRNARIIGKRFRLVHITAGGTIFEVSTFRSNRNGSVGNEFGTMDEDVLRRDFTFNALYYDPTDGNLVDFVGGYKDLKTGKIKPIIPLSRIFDEDPVRIIRGMKYGALAGFKIPFVLRHAIKRDAHLLAKVSASRMTEEFFKILASGKAEPIFRVLSEYKLLEYFVPSVWIKIQADIGYSKRLFADLKALDTLQIDISDSDIEGSGEDPSSRGKQKLSVILSYFLKSWILQEEKTVEFSSEIFRDALLSARAFIQPMNPPRVELEAAVLMILRGSGLSILQRPPKTGRRRTPASA